MNYTIDLHKPSFLARWLQQFFFERHALAARSMLFLVSLAFFLFGSDLVVLLARLLPTAQLGSSGSSVFAHQILQIMAGSVSGLLLACLLKPSIAGLEVSDSGLRLKKRIFVFPTAGNLLSWEKIDRICIERQVRNTDMRKFRLCLRSESDPQKSIRIPLANIIKESSKEELVNCLQEKAVKALIEPGTLEAIRPSKNLSFTEIWLEALSAAPSRERLTPLAEGTRLKERFKINKRLGGGGQATAYLAKDSTTESKIVLKETILPVYADLPTRKQSLAKFHEEALALKSLRHRQIVSYLDSFVEDHRAYLVLEYIEGKTLRKQVEEHGALPAKETIRLALQMCEILQTLHKSNPPLVHRDFTPDNLMLNKEENLVLIDFAVATTDEDSAEAAGKIAYMAPEQFQGSSSPQSDIYSCACCLNFLLTGKDPIGLSVAHPAEYDSSIPEELDRIVARGTDQDTETRYRHIDEMKKELESLNSSEHSQDSATRP